jgi:K+-transporting ATPase c subunit
MTRHQAKDIERSETLTKMQGQESAVWQRTSGNKRLKSETGLKKEEAKDLDSTVAVVETLPTGPTTKYELGLDEFIEMGRAKLKIGDMNISAANYISAIKVKADIESRTKDRRLEMLRSMFAGAAPTNQENDGRRISNQG